MTLAKFLVEKQGTTIFLLLVCLMFTIECSAQKHRADSLANLLSIERVDSNRVRLLWQMAGVVDIYSPDTALALSQQALYISKEMKYVEGQSKSLGALANTFVKMGNYPKAIEFYLEKLKLEENRNTPRNLASVLLNLGVVNVLQEEYTNALQYYSQADSVIKLYDIGDMKYFIQLNLGDVYNRLNQSDSAFQYFSRSLQLTNNDNDLIGTSMTGLGHTYLKKGDYINSALNYKKAISYLQLANDDEILCEATLGIANLYKQIKKQDSAKLYGTLSLNTAKRGGFLLPQLEAAEFLTNYYRDNKNIDSAFIYVNQVMQINDSLNSKTRIREAQIFSSNEQLRQLEIKENKKIAAKERFKQLQLLFIGIFIPGFFLFVLTLSRIRINVRLIKILGILSLIIFFEYLTLLLHPQVGEITHHIPVYEMLIFVALAAILIPLHHRIEHWLIKRLVHNQEVRQLYLMRLKLEKEKQAQAAETAPVEPSSTEPIEEVKELPS